MAKGARVFATLSFLALLPFSLFAQGFGYMDQIPEAKGFVNDYKGLLNPQDRARLEAFLTQNAQQTSNEIAVAIMDLPEGADIKQYTNDAARKWRIGGSDNNNGALLAVYPNERKVRIEVGYGLEPVITDALSGRIIREVIRPAFQREDYFNGIYRAAQVMVDAAQGEYDENSGRSYYTQPRPQGGDGGGGANLIVFVLIVVLVIWLIRRGGGGGGGGGFGRGGWSWFPLFWIFGGGGWGGGHHNSGGGFGGGDFGGGGFGGGDFGGFGGGDFGGGGADGGW